MLTWQRYLRNFCIFFLCSFVVTATVYQCMALLYAEDVRPIILGMSFRMFLYHGDHPFLYIAVVCLCYALLATFFAARIARGDGRATMWAWGVVLLSPILASPLGGMLWHYHDMMANRIPSYAIAKLLSGIGEGYSQGWFIILLGFPYNAICAWLGVSGTVRLAKKLGPCAQATPTNTRIHIVPLLLCYGGLLGAGMLLGVYSLRTVTVQAARIEAVITRGDAASVERFITEHSLDVTEKIPAVHTGYGATALSMAMRNTDKAVFPLVLQHATSPTAAHPAKVFELMGSTIFKRDLAETLRIAKACKNFPPQVQQEGFGKQRNKLHDLFEQPSTGDAAQRAELLQIFTAGGAFEVDYIHTWLRSVTQFTGDTEFYPPLLKAGIISPKDMDVLLASAARRNPSPAITSFFLRMGAQPNALGSQSFFEERQDTPILALSAAHNPNPAIVQLLLDAGANPNATDLHGNRVLDLLDEQLTIEQDSSKRDILLQKRILLRNAGAHSKHCNCPQKD